MAIINSLAIGKSVKSAGNLTYKTVRGRTIASQRIVENKSNTYLQQSQRTAFKNLSQSMQFMQAWIDRAYEKSKFGSSRNAFAKENPRFNLGGLLGEIKEGILLPLDGLLPCLCQPSQNLARQLRLFSKGSLPCVVNESTEVKASVTINDVQYTNLLKCSALSIDFYQSVLLSDCEFYAVHFGAEKESVMPKFQVLKGTVAENGDVTFKGLESDFSMKCTIAEGLVTHIDYTGDLVQGAVQGIVSVKGKVPTIQSFFVGTGL